MKEMKSTHHFGKDYHSPVPKAVAVSHLKPCRRRLRPQIPAEFSYLNEEKKITLLLVNHVASSVRGRKQKEHWFFLELQQKNPSFCKPVQSSQVPVMLLTINK